MSRGDDRLPVDCTDLFGRRVSLRHRIAAEDAPGPRLSDAIGELTDGDPGTDGGPTVRVRTRSGTVRIRVVDVVAVREVPAAPTRRASWSAVAHLEGLCADAWPPTVLRHLGEWRLRAGLSGFTRRANSTLAVGDPGVSVQEALDTVLRFADAHAIRPLIATPEGSPWGSAVRAEGWELSAARGARTIVLVGSLEVLAAAGSGTAAQTAVAIHSAPGRDWSAIFDERPDDAGLAARCAVLAPDGLTVGFGVARGHDRVATGAIRAALVDDHVYLSRLEVLARSRRAGVATALTAAAARWGWERGARHAVLQVERDNASARALYARLGCVEHHRCHYLAPRPKARC